MRIGTARRRPPGWTGVVTTALLALGAAGCATSSAPARGPIAPPPLARYAAGDDAAGAPGPHESASAFFDSHFSAEAWRRDVGAGYFGSKSILLPAGLAVAAAAISPWDHDISRHADESSSGLGEATTAVLLAGTAAMGILAPAEDRDGCEERWTIGESLALNFVLLEALKTSIGRRRPETETHDSFPSGHTSFAFAAATLIDRNSGHAYGIPAYLLAATTGYTRVRCRDHFPSDVFAGAALGVLTASVVDSLHFGGDGQEGGISRRSTAPELGVELAEDGSPLLMVTFRF